jgi:hypothetical protein
LASIRDAFPVAYSIPKTALCVNVAVVRCNKKPRGALAREPLKELEVLVPKALLSLEGFWEEAMLEVSKPNLPPGGTETQADRLEVSVRGNVILVREAHSLYYAFYAKPASHSALRKDGVAAFAPGDRPQLSMLRRKPISDLDLIARARQAAEMKARELGWIV